MCDLSHFYIKVMEATFLNHFKQRKCINDVFRRKEKLLKDRQSCPTNVSTVLPLLDFFKLSTVGLRAVEEGPLVSVSQPHLLASQWCNEGHD